MKTLSPLIERIEADIMGSDLLHSDDKPIRVLDRSMRDKGLGKGVRQGRIWPYVRDQRPWAGDAPPGAVYQFAPDWKEEHVLNHLANVRGILQADGYKGYAKLYEPGPDGLPSRQRLRTNRALLVIRPDPLLQNLLPRHHQPQDVHFYQWWSTITHSITQAGQSDRTDTA